MRLQVGSSRFQALVDSIEVPRSQRTRVVLTQAMFGTKAVLEAIFVAPDGIEVDSCANSMQRKLLNSLLELLLRTRREPLEVRRFHSHRTMLAPSRVCRTAHDGSGRPTDEKSDPHPSALSLESDGPPPSTYATMP